VRLGRTQPGYPVGKRRKNKKDKIKDMQKLKIIVLLLVTVVLASICGCGGADTDAGGDSSDISGEMKPDSSPDGNLQPPEWNIGDTWTVETEMFDESPVMPDSTPSWTAKQAWRFLVEDIKSSSKDRQYILTIKPVDDNRCPYWFKFWLRSPDLFVCSYELFYQEDTDDSETALASYRKYIAGDGSSFYFFEYFKNRFPTFPISLLPNFDNTAENIRARSAASPTAGQIRQQVVAISGAPPSDMLNRNLASRATSGHGDEYFEVTMEYEEFTETQYWKEGLPWPFFGHRKGGGSVEKRFHLTDCQRQ
jgi:hypothetical protein